MPKRDPPWASPRSFTVWSSLPRVNGWRSESMPLDAGSRPCRRATPCWRAEPNVPCVEHPRRRFADGVRGESRSRQRKARKSVAIPYQAQWKTLCVAKGKPRPSVHVPPGSIKVSIGHDHFIHVATRTRSVRLTYGVPQERSHRAMSSTIPRPSSSSQSGLNQDPKPGREAMNHWASVCVCAPGGSSFQATVCRPGGLRCGLFRRHQLARCRCQRLHGHQRSDAHSRWLVSGCVLLPAAQGAESIGEPVRVIRRLVP